jgi:hypothetical protein
MSEHRTPGYDKPRVVENDIPREEIIDLFEKAWSRRVFDSLADPSELSRLCDLVDRMRRNNRTTIVYTTGAFDILSLKHVAYLANTKLAAAGAHYDRHYAPTVHGNLPWSELDGESRRWWRGIFWERRELQLVVSVDSNDRISSRKGFDPAKGGAPRPVYDWLTRAREVANATMPVGSGILGYIADAVTVHDMQGQSEGPGDHFDVAAVIQPDVWSYYFESDDIETLGPADPRLADTTFVRIGQEDYFSDRFVGVFYTTSMVQRLLSGSDTQS